MVYLAIWMVLPRQLQDLTAPRIQQPHYKYRLIEEIGLSHYRLEEDRVTVAIGVIMLDGKIVSAYPIQRGIPLTLPPKGRRGLALPLITRRVITLAQHKLHSHL